MSSPLGHPEPRKPTPKKPDMGDAYRELAQAARGAMLGAQPADPTLGGMTAVKAAETTFTADIKVGAGAGFFGHAVPATQPVAPVTLADVIAIIRGCGLSA